MTGKKKHRKNCPFINADEFDAHCYKGCNWFDDSIEDCIVWTLRVLLKLLLEEKQDFIFIEKQLKREKEK